MEAAGNKKKTAFHKETLASQCKTQFFPSSLPSSSPDVLLELLNGVFQDNPIPNVSKLTADTVPGGQQSPGMYSETQYQIIHDVLARYTQGNAYVIEMERAFQIYDLVRFKYSIARAFVGVVDERFNNLGKGTTKAAETVTEAESKVKAEVEPKEKLKSKPVPNQLLFEPEDAPTVIVIVLVEDGLPKKQFKSEFSTGKYTVVSPFEKLGKYSKMNFVYIDLLAKTFLWLHLVPFLLVLLLGLVPSVWPLYSSLPDFR
jgi:hypothetical protein